MTINTNKERFEQRFLYTLKYNGQTCNSVDEIVNILKKDYEGIVIKDCILKPQKTDDFNFVSEPFSYIIAHMGGQRIHSLEYLGFKLDSEPFIRIGPPHYESSRERVCFGDVDGYRLYESPEKKHELMIHRSI